MFHGKRIMHVPRYQMVDVIVPIHDLYVHCSRYVAEFIQQTGLLQQFRFAFDEDDEADLEPSTVLEGLELDDDDDD